MFIHFTWQRPGYLRRFSSGDLHESRSWQGLLLYWQEAQLVAIIVLGGIEWQGIGEMLWVSGMGHPKAEMVHSNSPEHTCNKVEVYVTFVAARLNIS